MVYTQSVIDIPSWAQGSVDNDIHRDYTQVAFDHDGSIGVRIDFPICFGESNIRLPNCSCADMTSISTYTAQLSGDREGIMVDTGAYGNISGDKWIERTSKLMALHELSIKFTDLANPIRIEGVGAGGVTAKREAQCPIMVNGFLGYYKTPVVPDSDLPAILGFDQMDKQKAIVDCGAKRYVIPGPGGYKVYLSPGSQVIDCEKSTSGHLLMPVTDFLGKRKPASTNWTEYGLVPVAKQSINSTLGTSDGMRPPASAM